MEKLDLLLVNPSNRKNMYGSLGDSLSAIEPPLWTALVAAFVREKGFSVKIIDGDVDNLSAEYIAEKIYEYNPLLAGISAIGANPSASSTPKMAAASIVLNILKNASPRIKTFLYGIHPSALPEKTLKEEPVDFILRGECFYSVLKLLKAIKDDKGIPKDGIEGLWYIKNGNIVSNGWGKLVKDIDELPFAAWDLLPMDKYRAHNWHCFGHLNERSPYGVIYTSLGCPYACTYCNIHALYSGKPGIRFRSPKKVVQEIDILVDKYKIKNIKIIDELFVLKEDRIIELCDLIIKRGYDLNIWGYARIDTVNKTLLDKMERAGINWLCYGIESGSRLVRDGVAKGSFSQEAVKKIILMTKAAGISILGNFMFGLPDDDLKTMRETLDMAKELNCEYVNFYATMAYPGSKLYEKAVEKGIKLPETWDEYSQLNEGTTPLSTKYLSGAEVLKFRDEAFEEYYHNPAYLKMIEEKFGHETVEHIKNVFAHKIRRRLLSR